jgi:nucleotide-binding universal stress UspA family protein
MDTLIPQGSIVVGVDGSDHSRDAVVWATEQARLEHRPLLLAHAVDERLDLLFGGPNPETRSLLQHLREQGARLIDDVYAGIPHDEDSDLVMHKEVRLGDARQMLLDLSRDAAMVVVGSRGRGPVASLLLGSVSLAVSHHTACPVVVIHPDAVRPHGRIVVGMAYSRPISHSVEFAFRQASLRSLPLTVIHGFWDPLLGFAGATPVGRKLAELENEKAAIAEAVSGLQQKFPDVVLSYEAASGMPDDCLIRGSEGAAMVVVGSQTRGPVTSLLAGYVSRGVTEHAECAVAVVPESDGDQR